MATAAQCEQALQHLAANTVQRRASGAQAVGPDRSLSCTIRDLGAIFAGRLRDGELTDIHSAASADAQIRLELSSDDLLDLVAGRLAVPAAWASGRLKIKAGVRDMLRLTSLF